MIPEGTRVRINNRYIHATGVVVGPYRPDPERAPLWNPDDLVVRMDAGSCFSKGEEIVFRESELTRMPGPTFTHALETFKDAAKALAKAVENDPCCNCTDDDWQGDHSPFCTWLVACDEAEKAVAIIEVWR